MFKLIVSELAHHDLDRIVTYIAEELSSPKAALGFLDELEACYSILKDNPLIYSKCQDKRLEDEGYRKVAIKNYIAVYKVSEEISTVSILRFFYGAQDYFKLI